MLLFLFSLCKIIPSLTSLDVFSPWCSIQQSRYWSDKRLIWLDFPKQQGDLGVRKVLTTSTPYRSRKMKKKQNTEKFFALLKWLKNERRSIKFIAFMRRRLKVRVSPWGRTGTYLPSSPPSSAWPRPALNPRLLIFSDSGKKDRMRTQGSWGVCIWHLTCFR